MADYVASQHSTASPRMSLALNESDPPRLSVGQCATLACLLEATAPKAGNVHRGADFSDLGFADFAVSAALIGPAMESAATRGVGFAVYEAIAATRSAVATNTNLGMVLLIAPLAAVSREMPLTPDAVREILRSLTPDDCRFVYQAIRLAQPGGLGQVREMDVAAEPPSDLLAAMAAAADRDLVARQYMDDFRLVLCEICPAIIAGRERGWSLTESIVHTHVALLARHEDSLIVRKCGRETGRQAKSMAERVLEMGGPGDEPYYDALADFDFWLRADSNRRNPGTTADLIAAALFAALRDQLLPPPWR